MPKNSFLFRILVVLVLILVLVGVGNSVYRTGFTQGYIQGSAGSPGDASGLNEGFRYSPWMMRPHFGFFPFFPIGGFFLFGLLFLFLFGGLMRGLFFRGRHWSRPEGWHERRSPEGVSPLDQEPPVEDTRPEDR